MPPGSDIEYNIELNFLVINPQEFDFLVYRKHRQEGEKLDKLNQQDIWGFNLPENNIDENWQSYWITFKESEGYDEYSCSSNLNMYLTEQFLFINLLKSIQTNLPDKILKIGDSFNKRRIYISTKTFNVGSQAFWIEPYFLKSTQEIGFLLDFHFLQNEDTEFTKEIQRLSLSLDSLYHSNKSYHQDKYQHLEIFIKNIITSINPIFSKQTKTSLTSKLVSIDCSLLETKKYRFADEKLHASQFIGIKNFGPYQGLKTGSTHYFFIFTEKNIELGRDLFKALNGETFKYTFPGMKSMFNFPIGQENISRLSIDSYDQTEIQKIADEIEKDEHKNKIAIIIFPENESDFYYSFKNILLQNGILSQGIHIETLRDNSGLKWSISSIGLQLFSKSGGIPWRVKPSNENCLIIGIGQAHRFNVVDGERQITKYFSYSVLTDSSGKYVSMDVLSNEKTEDVYLNILQKNLIKIINKYKENYERITLHIPFKIRKYELDKIKDSIIEFGNKKEFVVLKINDKSKFFGYNKESNSRVPYESTVMKLSSRDYLLFPEGINYHNRNANKRYSNPLHIEFYYSSLAEITEETKKQYLQDILNLSGANWRGFNAKSAPISVFYPEIISHFIKEFDIRNLPEINFENLPPWFL